MSKILKYNNISVLHDDRYIMNKKGMEKDSSLDCDKKAREPAHRITQDIIYAQADDILARSKVQAAEILVEAKKQAESIKNEAYESGYSDGKAQGYEEGYNMAIMEGNEKLDIELKEIEKLRMAIYEEKAIILKQSEEELVMLALEIAEKIIDTELQNEKTYNNLVRKTLKNLKGRNSIKLYVSEEDFDRVSANRGYITSSIEGLDNIEIIGDEYLTRGSCIVDGGIGVIDGSVDTQLKQIEKALVSLLNCEESQPQGERYA